jgi:hypothetical protein
LSGRQLLQTGLGLKIQWYFRDLYLRFSCQIGRAFYEKYLFKEYFVTNSLIVLKKMTQKPQKFLKIPQKSPQLPTI